MGELGFVDNARKGYRDMFFRKKSDKDQSEQATNKIPLYTELDDEVFGRLVYSCIGLWKGFIETELFGIKSTVKVLIYTEEDDSEYVEPEQQQAFREYLSRKEELDALIISELRKGYGLDESFDLCKRFELNKLIIHSGGDFGFSFIDHNAEEGWSNRDVVVTVLPEVSYFGDEDDFA